jgi:putative nucleotidyltransferase with HDIG domain
MTLSGEVRQRAGGSGLLLIDDHGERRARLSAMLHSYYQVRCFERSESALAYINDPAYGALLLGEDLLANGDPHAVQILRAARQSRRLPVIIVAATGSGAAEPIAWSGADALLHWPSSRAAALAVISRHCELGEQSRWTTLAPEPRLALNRSFMAFSGIAGAILQGRPFEMPQIEQACSSLVTALNNDHIKTILDEVKHHNDYTFVHCLRVATFLALFGKSIGVSVAEQEVLAVGGLLHDVGKITVPNDLLDKPEKLSPKEYRQIQEHVGSTVKVLRKIPALSEAIIVMASQHHEKLDGTGYPLGLTGDRLNELARMAAIVDIFSAMTDQRSYKAAIEPEAALNYMAEHMGKQIDLRLLVIFRQCLLDAIN